MKMKIKLTQEHIDRGIPGEPTGCPLALAIRDAVPLAGQIDVGYHSVHYSSMDDKLSFLVKHSIRFPYSYDFLNGDVGGFKKWVYGLFFKIKPCEFELNVPDALLPKPKSGEKQLEVFVLQ